MNYQQESNVVTRADALWRRYIGARTEFRRLCRQSDKQEEAAIAHREMTSSLEQFAVAVSVLMDTGYYLVVHRNRIVGLKEVPLSRSCDIVDFLDVVNLVESFAASIEEGRLLSEEVLSTQHENRKEGCL